MAIWFRFYTEALNDPKVQELAPDVFKAWVNMLCVASESGGALPPIDKISFHLRCDIETANTFHKTLVEAGLVDVGSKGSRIHAWDKRQYKSDTSTERVKRFRKRSETVTVTPPEPYTEPDTERTPIVPKGTASKRKKNGNDPVLYHEFEESVWKEFPRHPNSRKDPAFQKFQCLTPEERIKCIGGVARYANRFEAVVDAKRTVAERLEYVPHLVTWINQKGWQSEYERQS